MSSLISLAFFPLIFFSFAPRKLSEAFFNPLEARKFLRILLLTVAASPVMAQPHYTIDLAKAPRAIQRGRLNLGGTGAGGASIAVNSFYIEQNGKPFVPIVGEFHYCRYPADGWEESLRKMKAGGINVVASYVFWNIHERAEGQFDWSGNLDLRRFVELAGRVGLQAIVRIGPFGHGEIRNGGLPDWIYGRALEIRSNDSAYLAYVDKLYAAISAQLKGLLYKDGGPVIGIQLENEFQHSAAPWEIRYAGAPKEFTVAERDVSVTHGGVSVSTVANQNTGYGRDHLANLKLIAQRNGLDVPIYTATGWGNAAIVPTGSIPVTAGYPYPFWAPVEPSPFYLFKDIRKNPDYAPVSYDTDLYPSIPAELGSGIMPIYARRPFVPEESIEPLIVRVLGSGSNGIGYYMYHGGATPSFDHFYNEDASGLPKINYDYQAPIGQYGQVRGHFRSLRLLHFFLRSYGERLAPLQSILPQTNAGITAENTSTLRYAARAADGSGFLFLLNFQDHVTTRDLEHLQLAIVDGRRTITIPSTGEFTLKQGACAILPVNLDLGGTMLRSATVQPLTVLRHGGRQYYVFFSIDGLPPEMVFESGTVSALENCQMVKGDGVTVSGPADRPFSFLVDQKPVLVVPRSMALLASETPDGRLMFADATVLSDGDREIVLSSGKDDVSVNLYPASANQPILTGAKLETAKPDSPVMSAFRIRYAPVKLTATMRKIATRKYALRFDGDLRSLNEAIMRVNYTGDTGMAFIDGQMVDDHFYFGRTWEIGLKRFLPRLAGKEMVFVFQPLRRDATYLDDLPEGWRPVFADGQKEVLEVRAVEFIPEYKAIFQLR